MLHSFTRVGQNPLNDPWEASSTLPPQAQLLIVKAAWEFSLYYMKKEICILDREKKKPKKKKQENKTQTNQPKTSTTKNQHKKSPDKLSKNPQTNWCPAVVLGDPSVLFKKGTMQVIDYDMKVDQD